MADQAENKTRTKRPTALKRDIQNSKRRIINKAFQNRVKTAIRRFELSLSSKDNDAIKGQLNDVYSLMDKGVKRGVFKINKASRTKSRLTARAHAHLPA